MKQPDVESALAQVVERLVEALRPRAIWLFGSHAAGAPHERSDLDLLIVVDDDAGDVHDLTAKAYCALPAMSTPIDLVICHQSSIDKWAPVKFSLPYEAIHTGRRLYAA